MRDYISACVTDMVCTAAATSWTRRIDAPERSAAVLSATVPGRASSAAIPHRRVIIDFLEMPTSTGRLNARLIAGRLFRRL